MSALWRIVRRELRARPGQPLLAAFAVALGVAVVVGVGAANQTALRSFERSARSLTGSATHRVVGGPGGVADRVYPRLRRELGLRAAAPAVEGHARRLDAAGERGRTLRVVGSDPFVEAPLRPWLAFAAAGGAGLPVGPLLTEPGAVLVTPATAAALGVAGGDALRVQVAGRPVTLRVVGLLRPRDELARRGLDDVLLCDVATAQEVLDEVGRLDRIDLRLDDDAAAARLRAWLAEVDPALRLEPRRAERGALDELTRAFRLNLRALSLLALLVGAFLVHNAMQLAVVRRRELLGVLRAVGASRRQVFAMVLGEAALLGAVGAAAGLPLGLGLAQGLLGLVGATMQDLYTPLAVPDAAGLAPWSGAAVVALGLGAALVAALGPAVEATGVVPRLAWSRAHLEGRARRWTGRAAVLGLLLAGAGALAGRYLPGGVTVAFAATFAVLIGAAMAAPGAMALLLRLARAPLGAVLGTAGRQAARAARAGLSRTAVATAALTLAVAATVGLGVMIQSFRGSVSDWLRTTLVADAYAAVPRTMATRSESRLQPATLRALLDVPAVGDHASYRRIEVDSPRGAVELAAVRPAAATLDGWSWLRGDREAAAAALHGGDAVLCSEPLAARLGLQVGDLLRLRTDRGLHAFRVAAVFRDYATERGHAVIARSTYRRHWDDDAVTSLALWAGDGVSPAALVAALREAAAPLEQQVLVRSTGALRAASLEVFDRTFEVTTALRLLCTLVAFLGVLGALTALQLERARETAVLRAVGATPAQLAVATTLQNALLGMCAGLLAIPTGIALGWLLVAVVHRRSFGWTLLRFEVPPGVLVSAVLLSVAAAVLGSLWPVWQTARRQDLAAALREE